MIYGFTGHRPPKLGGYSKDAQQKLYNFAHKVVRIYLHAELHVKGYPIKSDDSAIIGMAQGWDMAVASACVALTVPFVAAVPFPGQELVWPQEARSLYTSLLENASRVVFTHPTRVSSCRAGEVSKILQLRNQYIVDHSSKMIALYSGDINAPAIRGGTANCIRYAMRQKVEVINVWKDWEAFS